MTEAITTLQLSTVNRTSAAESLAAVTPGVAITNGSAAPDTAPPTPLGEAVDPSSAPADALTPNTVQSGAGLTPTGPDDGANQLAQIAVAQQPLVTPGSAAAPVYPMMYSLVDGSTYAVTASSNQAPMLPAPATAYYIPAPVYSYQAGPVNGGPPAGMENGSGSAPGSSYFVNSGAPVQPPPPLGNPDGTPLHQVVYTTYQPNSQPVPSAVYYPSSSQYYPAAGYSYGQTGWVSSCTCAACRAAFSAPPPPHQQTSLSAAGTPMVKQSLALGAAGEPESLPVYPISGQSGTPAATSAAAARPRSPAVGANTPLSSRPTASESDLRRRLFQNGANGRATGGDNGGHDSNEDSPPSPPTSALSDRERKKRKMGYLNNILYKTEICRDYQQAGTCPRGKSCQFAHGGGEVHHPKNHPLYKTAFCFDYKKDGKCPRGDACFHVHHAAEMRDKPNRARGNRGPRFGRCGRLAGGGGGGGGSGTPKGSASPLVFTRSRGNGGPGQSPMSGGANNGGPGSNGSSTANTSVVSVSGGHANSPTNTAAASNSGDAIPNPSDVKNTMRLLQRLTSENTAHLLKKLSEDDSLRASPIRH